MCRPIGHETGGGDGGLCANHETGSSGGWFLHADCVTGSGLGDYVLDSPAPGVVLGLFL